MNHAYMLVTFPQFVRESAQYFRISEEELHARNWTADQSAGWTEDLYEAVSPCGTVVVYTQNLLWEVHRGSVGRGATLAEARANLVEEAKASYEVFKAS